ncbi:glycerol-3-phosphate dehydrogenase [Massilia sp. W12]|uniref:glycerol-3-phosphate dehydrogenase n=1 Tax=Massilia sp. W12 TaxID=3126507 RepID=UPI0030D5C2FD
MQTQPPQAQAAYDLLVVGGGINGCGIARDAAGRGLRVLLVEQDDLAQHTSSASTKLIHGGLRYLEYYEFSLVRKALQEREVLLRMAPHISHPLQFVMPHAPHQRPAWMIRCGLFLYDHLARRAWLPGSSMVRLAQHEAGAPLQPQFSRAFTYADGWVDDARLVVLNALDAQERGATILTRTRCLAAQAQNGAWQVQLEDDKGQRSVTARALVNAAGPWAARFANQCSTRRHNLRLVQGSHIIVPRLFSHPHAYLFQNDDGRIMFALPFQEDFTLIGTTDCDYHGDPAQVAISAQEIDYLCAQANRYFQRHITPADVRWSYAGVRPLLDEDSDAAAVSRDYKLELQADAGAPLLHVWGGKLTTYRKLAQDAMEMLLPSLAALPAAARRAWSHSAPLPGGDLQQSGELVTDVQAFAAYCAKLAAQYPFLPQALLQRLARAYGARTPQILGQARSLAELGEEICPGLYAAEVRYLQQVEWARSAEDILWRRSKLGLRASAQQVENLRQRLQPAP